MTQSRILTIIAVALVAVSCSEKTRKHSAPENPILGVWIVESSFSIEFFEDNTLLANENSSEISGKWIKLSDGRYKIDLIDERRSKTIVFDADFSEDGKMIVRHKDDNEMVWLREDHPDGKSILAKKDKKRDLRITTNNAKQLFYLLVEFDQDYGEYPSDRTAVDELKSYKGTSSNDYLGQFIAGGYTSEEGIFYAKGGSPTDKKPDNVIDGRSDILSAGECGFAYIKNQSTSVNSNRPLLLAPMTGDGLKFDSEPYDGFAVVLRADGAVKQYPIDENGNLVLPDGKSLWAGGEDSIWSSKGFNKENLVFPK